MSLDRCPKNPPRPLTELAQMSGASSSCLFAKPQTTAKGRRNACDQGILSTKTVAPLLNSSCFALCLTILDDCVAGSSNQKAGEFVDSQVGFSPLSMDTPDFDVVGIHPFSICPFAQH